MSVIKCLSHNDNNPLKRSNTEIWSYGNKRPSVSFPEDLLALQTRVKNLELENCSLRNDIDSYRLQNLQSTASLENNIQTLASENLNLKNIITEIREEMTNFRMKVERKEAFETLQQKFKENCGAISSLPSLKTLAVMNNNMTGRLSNSSVEEETRYDPNYRYKKESSPFMVSDGESDKSWISLKENECSGFDEFYMKNYQERPPKSTFHTAASLQVPEKIEKTKSAQENLITAEDEIIISLKESRRLKSADGSQNDNKLKEIKFFRPKNLFENLLVVGTTEEAVLQKIKSASKLKEDETILLAPQILFNYAEKAQLDENVTLPNIEGYLSPKGISLNLISSSNRAGDILSKIILKLNRKHKKRFICPFQPHTNDIFLSKWSEEIDAINPQNKLYAIGIQKKDYLLLPNSKSDQGDFVQVSTVYCILTYYPVPQFFLNILSSILNMIRKKRKEIFWHNKQKDTKIVSLTSINKILTEDIISYLKLISQLPLPCFESTIEYPFTDKTNSESHILKYMYPNQRNAYHELLNWEAAGIFSKFGLEDIQLILSAIMLDKYVMFFSENITLLSSAINFFLGLLHPLKFIGSLIPLLPFNLLKFCESPMPIIIGINRREEYFFRKKLGQNSKFMFVFMDSKTIFIDEENTDTCQFPMLDFITQNLEKLYSQVNPQGSKFEVINQYVMLESKYTMMQAALNKRNSSLKRRSEMEEIHADPALTVQILDHMREWMEDNVVRYLDYLKPSENVYEMGKMGNFSQKIDMLIQNENIAKFFHAFSLTKGFNNYPY